MHAHSLTLSFILVLRTGPTHALFPLFHFSYAYTPVSYGYYPTTWPATTYNSPYYSPYYSRWVPVQCYEYLSPLPPVRPQF